MFNSTVKVCCFLTASRCSAVANSCSADSDSAALAASAPLVGAGSSATPHGTLMETHLGDLRASTGSHDGGLTWYGPQRKSRPPKTWQEVVRSSAQVSQMSRSSQIKQGGKTYQALPNIPRRLEQVPQGPVLAGLLGEACSNAAVRKCKFTGCYFHGGQSAAERAHQGDRRLHSARSACHAGIRTNHRPAMLAGISSAPQYGHDTTGTL